MDLRSFAEKNQPEKDARIGGLNEKDVKRAINHFSGMSNDQLMRELSKHISAKKRAGKEAEIYSVIERIRPFLNPEQKSRLDEIIRSFE